MASPRTGTETGDEERNFRGLAWSRVSYAVPNKSTYSPLQRLSAECSPELAVSEQGTKQILKSVSGFVRTGEILFVMGPSGAGKSALLDALAFRLKGTVTGNIGVHGRTANEEAFRHASKYIQQDDSLLDALTVQETINFAADFYVRDKDDRRKRVETMIHRLGLQSARNTLLGGVLSRGISEGEARRLLLGVELIAQPEMVVLDEPTSGLDSTSAEKIVRLLREVADSGTAVICTIHQPSQRLFALSDRLLLLAEGRVAYFGKTMDVLSWFQSIGFQPPPRTSIPEWILDLLTPYQFNSKENILSILAEWESRSKSLEAGIKDMQGRYDLDYVSSVPLMDKSRFSRHFWAQLCIFTKRNFVVALRNPGVVYYRGMLYLAMSLIIGLAWYRIPAEADRAAQFTSLVFYTSTYMTMMATIVLSAYLDEKKVVTRERFNRTYSTEAYLLGHLACEVVYMCVLALPITVIIYYLTNLNPMFSRAAFFYFALVVSFMAAESLVTFIAAVVGNLIVGIVLSGVTIGTFIVVEGYLKPVTSIPWPLRWLEYIGMQTFAFAALCINEFQGRNYTATPNSFPPFPNDLAGDVVLDVLSFALNNKWANLAALLGLSVFYRVLAYAWILKFHNGKR